jgi:hypothetical protein
MDTFYTLSAGGRDIVGMFRWNIAQILGMAAGMMHWPPLQFVACCASHFGVQGALWGIQEAVQNTYLRTEYLLRS